MDLPSFTPIFAKFDVISVDVNRKIMTDRKLLAMPGCPRWELVAVAPRRQGVRNSYELLVGGLNGGNSHEL